MTLRLLASMRNAPAALSVVALLALASAAPAVTIDWVSVGDPGNAADTLDGDVERAGVQQLGAVSYAYRIARHEVTNAQYTEFLNAVDPTGINSNGLYNPSMGTSLRGGIALDPLAAAGAKYSVKTHFDAKPVNFVSFFDGMRFVNWLENGQGAGGTETGVYAIGDGLSETRAAGARFFLPNEDEWYKAAYYDPTPGAGGFRPNYWLFPTQSDALPVAATANATGDVSNPGPNVINYNGATWNGVQGNVTTVGSALSTSFYGTLDQGGNVQEWIEATVPSIFGAGAPLRVNRGGGLASGQCSTCQSRFRGAAIPGFENDAMGFRIGSVIPEPSTASLLALGLALLARRRRGD